MESAAKILVVDDNEQNLALIRAILRKHGHEPLLARSGEEALRRVLQDPPVISTQSEPDKKTGRNPARLGARYHEDANFTASADRDPLAPQLHKTPRGAIRRAQLPYSAGSARITELLPRIARLTLKGIAAKIICRTALRAIAARGTLHSGHPQSRAAWLTAWLRRTRREDPAGRAERCFGWPTFPRRPAPFPR